MNNKEPHKDEVTDGDISKHPEMHQDENNDHFGKSSVKNVTTNVESGNNKSVLKKIFSIFLFILKPFIFLAKFILRIAIIVAVFYLIFHYVNIYDYLDKDRLPAPAQVAIDYAQETSIGGIFKEVFSYIPVPKIFISGLNPFSSENTLAINTNPDSDVGAVLDFDNGGGGSVVYTTEYQGKEKINKIIGHSKKGEIATININPETLLPTKTEFNGYTYNYHRFTNIGVDISVTDPEGNTSEIETVLFDQALTKGNFLLPVANAGVITKGVSWVAINIQKFVGKKAAASSLSALDFDATMDPAMWAEYISKIESISTCAVGLVTMVVPNPASGLAIAVGCGSYLAETIPQYSSVAPDICNTKDVNTESCVGAIINWATSGLDKGDFYLQGSVKAGGFLSGSFTSDATLTFTHKDGTVITIKTPKRFGSCRLIQEKKGAFVELTKEENCTQGRILKQGAHSVVVSAEGFITRQFVLAISDDRVLIKEGKETVFDEKREGSYSKKRWGIVLKTIEEEELDKEITEPDKGRFDGSWKGKGTATEIGLSDYSDECRVDIPFSLEIKSSKATGKPDIKIKYDVISISGKIDDDGKMVGKVKALRVITLGTFDVQFTGGVAKGTWDSERFKCSGVVNLQKK